ncbi:gliding motility-associated C-terminal domain-containing protein [Myroides sp. 1354]|uniref:gliding motility-associated C-terminal domain-containing protein n=1 Tax=unclassified Myroides TaxID=2642485 RepID=UPI0025768D5E|nr:MULTISPECIES: gliding motility-associated C-terminal domain-containing protein [unclassified Myroides]MDM1045841.1 gliding motility-associated C-terminal domain-containing protein [Myroides sp. R163-1]MDM1055704.1 gliding motility-associated C-terminal domain-containing protein [Myroides sp. 1354]MDM1069796.1 gliding motility-associated C-terminal domain-containing protein [Myroides sp. 1372]
MKKIIYTILLFGYGNILLYAQEVENKIVNEGELSVSPEGLVSFERTFENQVSGDVTNDGTVLYYHDFINDGGYSSTEGRTTSTTIFTVEGMPTTAKQIKGNEIASFYNVIFDSPVSKVAFDLKNNIDASGLVDFQQGIILVDSTYNPITKVSHGMFTFKKGAKAQAMGDASHIQGAVEKIGNEVFIYPIGGGERYRPARISASKAEGDIFVGQYVYKDAAFFASRPNKVGVIKAINDQEYWIVDKGSDKQSDVLLTLTWDESTTAPEVLTNPEEELHIVRWDAKQQLWVDEGGVVDMSTKEVTTIGIVKGYGVFTLGTVKKDWILDGDIVIYNLVTPDGDGKNDYFIIDNIKNYPNNKVEIFNRWGARVYETTNYDPYGDGSTNVFKGYSEGKVTVDKGMKLPSGTYYYVITYEYTDANGSRMIKKAANLHLETN